MGALEFLRPWWLAGAGLAPLLAAAAWWGWQRADPWLRICDERLLRVLKIEGAERAPMVPFALVGALGALGAVALAGPSWDTLDLPVFRAPHARVLVLDLSRSMDAEDVEPSRMARARAKAEAVLVRTAEELTGLVVFAGDGFAVLPLTTDADTLIGLLPAFDPTVMPVQGSRPDRGLQEAGDLLARSGGRGGDIVLITDGARGQRAVGVAARLRAQGIRVSVIAVGTAGGGRIPLSGGAYLRDLEGRTLVAETPLELLRDVARAGGGRFAVSTADDRDVEHILAGVDPESDEEELAAIERPAAIRIDRGPWLALALLPLAALAFRRGWLVALACLALVPAPPAAAADRAGAGVTLDGSPPGASPAPDGRGSDWRWIGVDLYRAGRFPEAANMFANGDLADDHYNRGNALAKAGLLRAALAAYGEAIARMPEHEDARFNRAIVGNLLEQRARQQENQRRSTEDLELLSSTGESARAGSSDGSEGAADALRAERGAEALDEQAEASEGPSAAAARRAARRMPADRADEGPEPEAASVSISAGELEQMEEALAEIVEERLGLWRRKIELKWSKRERHPPDRTDAW